MARSNKSGFLLYELIVVLSLLVLFYTLCMYSFSFLDRMLVKLQLQELCVACYMQQQKAVTQKKDLSIVCNPQTNEIFLDDRIYTLNKSIQFGVLPNTKGPPANPKAIISKPITFTNNTINCFKNGTISAGTIYMVDRKNQCMYALSNAVGSYPYLRLYRYATQWYKI